jgi:DNA-binding CsgD family transcriptional regulator
VSDVELGGVMSRNYSFADRSSDFPDRLADDHDVSTYARPVPGISWPLLGRDVELAQLATAIDDPECGGVVLIGAAGLGKTRLATHALEMAASRGLTTSSVRATRSGAGIPFAALASLLPELDLPIDATASLLRAAALAIDERRGDGPFVLMVDDAQDLDDASVALLDHLVSAGSMFVVLTVRSDQSDASSAEIWQHDHIVRIDLAPLADAEVRALATIAVGGPLEGVTLQSLAATSAGNALFLRELIDGGLESGSLANRFGLWRLDGPLVGSSRLQDLIGRRLAGLPAEQLEGLELIALGDPIELSLLISLLPLEVIEKLESRGIIEAGGVSDGRMTTELEIRLAHPLYGEVVRANLSPLRRTRLCAALADAGDRLGSTRPHDVLRVAVWRLDGGGGGRPENMILAATAAFRSEAYDLAARLARAGWKAGGGVEASCLLGQSLDKLGRLTEAETVLAATWTEASTDREWTSLAVTRAAVLFRGLGHPERADEVVAEALTHIHDPACVRELEALRANNLLFTGAVARTLELTRPLLEQPGDPAFAQASLDTGTALALAGHTAEAIRHCDAALSARVDLDDEAQLSAVGVYVVARSLALVEAGELEEAAATAEGGYSHSLERANSDGQAWFASILGRVRLTQGRLETAAHLFREVSALFGELGHPGQRWGLGGLALAAGQMGDRHAGHAAIAELDSIGPNPVRLMDVDIHRGRAWVAVADGDLAGAHATLWAAVDLAEGWGQFATGSAALHDLVRLGAGPTAARRLEQFAEQADGRLVSARVRHAQAIDTSDADLASAAADDFEQLGALLLAAEATSLERRLAIGQGLRRRATAAGARVTDLLDRCEGAHTPALAEPTEADRLSRREREIALLAASGSTSREIADHLYLSVRTVDNHLQRAYAKLGVTSRSELATALDR